MFGVSIMGIEKAKTLFDHLNAITSKQDPNYWSTLSESDKKSWSNYMILRFLSMEPEWVAVISEIQPVVQTLQPEQLYKVLIGIIPKGRKFLKYVKGNKKEEYEDWLISLISNFYMVNDETATTYARILYSSDTGRDAIRQLCEYYGTDPKKIKKLKLDG